MSSLTLFDAKTKGFDDAVARNRPDPNQDAAAYSSDPVAQQTWREAYMAGFVHAQTNFVFLTQAKSQAAETREQNRGHEDAHWRSETKGREK